MQQTTKGIILAIAATIIWSGNFIIARGVIADIPPVALAFARWLCASVIMIPIGLQSVRADWHLLVKHRWHICWASITGVSIFNTMVYIAGHYTEALNLALIGTTSSPIFALLLARIILKESISGYKLAGLLLCITGLLAILSQGDWQKLIHLELTKGDVWIILGAFSFAVYNIIARKKPSQINPVSYVAVTFWIGTLILLPWWWYEKQQNPLPIHFTPSLGLIILYLGAGASVASFFCWNAAIARLGAARTAIFGNLIPVFSSIEAVIMLHEKMIWAHIAGMLLVFAGVFIANVNPATFAFSKKNQKG